MALLESPYGYFTDDGREYVITRPDTPMPWVNVLSNGDWGLTISQAGGGYSWRTHASLNRITRWDQDLVRDNWGKYLYIRDAESGEFWSPTWEPAGRDLKDYRVRHGLGYTVIEGRQNNIRSEVTYLVPFDQDHRGGPAALSSKAAAAQSESSVAARAAPCEIWLVRLTHEGERGDLRRLQLFSYFEWLLGAAPDWHREFHRLFIKTEYDAERGVLLATKRLWELPGEGGPHWNRDWPYVAFHSAGAGSTAGRPEQATSGAGLPAGAMVAGGGAGGSEPELRMPVRFDADKLAFLGRLGALAAPEAVQRGRSGNTAGRGNDAIGSVQIEVTVRPGETVEAAFVLGAADDRDQALALAERYRDPEAAHAALEEIRSYWRGLTLGLSVQTPDPALNVLANAWLPYQAVAGRLWGRTAYYQMGGAYGFRDQLQDSLAWLLLGRPEETMAQIRLHAAHQFRDGTVLHWWHPLAETGLASRYSDDLLWLPYVTLAYLDETGEMDCLDQELPFYDGGSATLREHCLAAFDKALGRRSARGLPLILEGDWNDGLNATGAQGRGESIWMAHFLHYLLNAWAELPSTDEETRGRFYAEADLLAGATNRYGWDGAWFWRATTDDGRVLGSRQDREGQIFLNAQTWAVLSESTSDERQEQAMIAAREHLYTPYGALLLAPPYTEPDPAVGYLTRYAPGTRENGGVYVHASCWAVLAERKLHGAQAAYDLWRTFCPPHRGEDADAYQAEPYVMPGNVDGPLSPQPGKAGWTWYTGSSQWYLRATIEGVLGIRATLEGLAVDPSLPDGWDGYRITRRFRGATYEISVRRAAEGEAASCTVGGEPWEAQRLPVAQPGEMVRVEFCVG